MVLQETWPFSAHAHSHIRTHAYKYEWALLFSHLIPSFFAHVVSWQVHDGWCSRKTSRQNNTDKSTYHIHPHFLRPGRYGTFRTLSYPKARTYLKKRTIMVIRQANGLELRRVQSIVFYVRRDIDNTLDLYGRIFFIQPLCTDKKK